MPETGQNLSHDRMAEKTGKGRSGSMQALLGAGLLGFGLLFASASQTPPPQEKTVIEINDEELLKHYRDQLKSLEFSPNQDQLEPLLKKVGENVKRFFRDFSNASAKEEVEKTKAYHLSIKYPYLRESQKFEEYRYLILPGKTETSWIEDRTDQKNRPARAEASEGFIMSSGYAAYSLYLHPSRQSHSLFRYLGREAKKPRAHVIAFAQKPESGDFLGQFREEDSKRAIRFLVQGFIWVDPDNYQILRMFTTMLSTESPTKLRETKTDIFYSKVAFDNAAQEFWVPREIYVEWELPDCRYANRHKYSDYHFFAVQSDYRIGQPEANSRAADKPKARKPEIEADKAIAANDPDNWIPLNLNDAPPDETLQPAIQQTQEDVQQEYKISLDVGLVTLDVTVIGGDASRLKAEDFLIYDNGVSQKVEYFSHDLFPLAIALLVDRSGSITPYVPMLQLAAQLSLRHLRPEDQVALFSFGEGCQKLSDLTGDHLLIAEKINTITTEGGTNIYDAIRDVALYLREKAPNRRRAIILVSDNCQQSMNPSAHPGRALSEILEAATTLYSIRTLGFSPTTSSAFAIGPNPVPIISGPSSPALIPAAGAGLLGGLTTDCSDSNAQIKIMADETGGESLTALDSLQASLESAIKNLRYQYTLGFYPSERGERGSYRKLTVKLAAEDRHPNCKLLARRGYYAGISAPVPPQNAARTTLPDSSPKTEQLLIQRSILIAGTAGSDLTEIPFTVTTSKQADTNGKTQIKIRLNVDPAKITFQKGPDRLPGCNLYVTFFYADKKGNVLDSDWKRLVGTMNDETYNRIMKEGIVVATTVPFKDKSRILKVVVYDQESGRIGSKLVKLP
jgi:VWFA-related protein